jgi:hypothetical protein
MPKGSGLIISFHTIPHFSSSDVHSDSFGFVTVRDVPADSLAQKFEAIPEHPLSPKFQNISNVPDLILMT